LKECELNNEDEDEDKDEDEDEDDDEEEETEMDKFFENKHILENIVEDYYAFCIKGEDYDDLTLKTMVSQVTFATFDGLLGKSGTDDLSGMDFWRIFIHMGIEEGAYQPLNGDEYDGFLYYLYRYINKE
jgi:hypothetical protein